MNVYVIIIIIVIAAALAFPAICAVCGVIAALTVIRPEKRPEELCRQRDIEFGNPECFDDYDNIWERHDFTLETYKATISGEYIINPANSEGRKKVAIICHGHTVMRLTALKYGRVFYNLGYNLIIFDQRYFGKSQATFCTLGLNESQDVKKIIAFAKEIFGEDCFLCLHGESMGGGTSLLLLDTEKPDFVVADCPFGDTKKLMFYQLERRFRLKISRRMTFAAANAVCRIACNYDMRSVNPIESVRKTDVPICFIHGAADVYVPCVHSKMMFEAVRNPDSELHIIPGAGHARCIAIDRPGYERIVKEFAEKIESKSL